MNQDWGKVVGRRPCYFKEIKPVNQDWGKVVVGRCGCYLKDIKPVNQDWGKNVGRGGGGADVILKTYNLSTKIGVKLLGGAHGILMT